MFLPTSRVGRWLGIGAQATVYPALVLLEAAMHPCHSNAVYYSPASAATITTFTFTATSSDPISKAAFYFICLIAAIVGTHAARLVAFRNTLALRATTAQAAARGRALLVGGDARGRDRAAAAEGVRGLEGHAQARVCAVQGGGLASRIPVQMRVGHHHGPTRPCRPIASRGVGVGGGVRGGSMGARSWSLASASEYTGENDGGDGDGGGGREGHEGGGSHRASVCTHHLLVERVGGGDDEAAPESSVPAAMAVAAAATASVTASVTARGRRRDEVRCAAEVGAAHVIPTAAFARPMNLLIVDNDAMVRLTMATLLQQCGYNVETAKNGREGLAMMKMQRFHLTLSDIIMPVIDGIEMTRQLREWEAVHRPAWRQPLMLMSAAANNELSQRVSR